MTAGGFALGVDIGTGGVRAALIDRAGDVSAEAAAEMAEFGANRRAPSIWRAALVAALERLGAKADLGRVEAIAVDGTSGTVLALDAGGAPIGDALMYNDAIEDEAIPAAIAAAGPRESAAHGASSALARAIALQTRPGAARIVHQADWIAELIRGAPGPSDASNALKTGYDAVAGRWPDWLDQTPLNRALLPEVVAVGAETGRCAGAFGLPAGAKLVAGASDGCASFLATGAAAPGEGVTALGTTLTIKLLSDKPIFAPEYGIYSHRIGDVWLAGGASNTGGGALASVFSPDRIEALSATIDPTRPSGLDYYPLPARGERFPTADPALAPRMSPRPENDALYLHGLLEGIARIEADGYAKLAELGAPPLTRLRTVGGGARNAVWSAIRSRILGAPTAPARSESAAVGVARLAARRLPPT